MFPCCCCRVLREQPRRRLAHCLPSDHPFWQVVRSASLSSIHRKGVERWPKPQRHPGVPTPICSIEVVKAASSQSLSARSRRETYFRKNSPIGMGRTFRESASRCSYVTLSSGTSVMTSCASVSERIHSSSLDCFEVVSFFVCVGCVLRRKRHSSGKSPVARLVVRLSGSRGGRLFWPTPAKETMASRCSTRFCFCFDEV